MVYMNRIITIRNNLCRLCRKMVNYAKILRKEAKSHIIIDRYI